ncbi:Cys/Met metabolism PLP-dependent enzyme-domain-containing protein [Syncephalis pseudoplumigaleata]|uniref:Cystathionine beta-lyase n=1 Tax=Syncephalis pseudoplumigaleata TaxID=1712513 RepID=A0A4P9Z114_9FUNG|nr:Cys/Met metabolism PLP-dependent enzyme-domain-containing protein [Syncephalis pseudoplumigaleata]|eukprot:RKP25070.1 Cys/Met metabolism PLP-dependent enzyme-domain-containing protein [Syncephalis pseudoplumigaleata]
MADTISVVESVSSLTTDATTHTNEAAQRRRYRLATELVSVDSYDEAGNGVRDPYRAASVPIYQTATFKQTSATQCGEYDYSRSGNPTRSHLESHMAKVMGASRAFAVTSGMTALDVIMRLVRAGNHVIAGDDLYGGTNRLLGFLREHAGIHTHHVDTTNVEAVAAQLEAGPVHMVLLETPTNPMIRIADVQRIATLVHERSPDAIVVVDNTMMSPFLQRTLNLGADIEYHSGTKYLSGHHDLMAGVIGVRSAALAERVGFVINAAGCGLGPFDCWLLLRGVKTLAVRMERQQRNAERVAQFLEQRGFRVHYPGLPSHPQYELHRRLADGPGAVLSFETGDTQLSERIVESARLWGISVSFGCVNSLISMPCRMSHASIPAEIRKARQLPEDVIRLCVGIEDGDDLLEDLDRALRVAGCSSTNTASEETPSAPHSPVTSTV